MRPWTAVTGRCVKFACIAGLIPMTLLIAQSHVAARLNPGAGICRAHKVLDSAPRAGAAAWCASEVPADTISPVGTPGGDQWPAIEFGVYGNSVYDDCTLAAVADLEQIYLKADAPLVSNGNDASRSADPFVAEYLRLAGGSATTGLPVTTVLDAWKKSPINGVQIVGYAPVPTEGQTIRAELRSGTPLLAWFYLPPQSVLTDTSMPRAPWTPASAPVDTATDGTHVAVLVGMSSKYVDIATWGGVQQVSWSWWSQWAIAAWSVTLP